MADLKRRGYEQAVVVGGGQINALFLKASLIDEIWLTVEPLTFGSGVDLFRSFEFDLRARLLSVEKLNEAALFICAIACANGRCCHFGAQPDKVERRYVAQHIVGDGITLAQGQEVHVLALAEDFSGHQAGVPHNIKPVVGQVHANYGVQRYSGARRLEARKVGSCYAGIACKEAFEGIYQRLRVAGRQALLHLCVRWVRLVLGSLNIEPSWRATSSCGVNSFECSDTGLSTMVFSVPSRSRSILPVICRQTTRPMCVSCRRGKDEKTGITRSPCRILHLYDRLHVLQVDYILRAIIRLCVPSIAGHQQDAVEKSAIEGRAGTDIRRCLHEESFQLIFRDRGSHAAIIAGMVGGVCR